MPLTMLGDEVRLIDTCGADEALELAEWLSEAELPKVDLGSCTHMHAALLQTLLTYNPIISVEPQDVFLRRWIAPMLALNRETAKER
jgi:hypothetical protein